MPAVLVPRPSGDPHFGSFQIFQEPLLGRARKYGIARGPQRENDGLSARKAWVFAGLFLRQPSAFWELCTTYGRGRSQLLRKATHLTPTSTVMSGKKMW